MEQNFSTSTTSIASLTSWLIDWLARELRIDRSSIDPGQSFLSYGMDSVQAMTMVGDLESMLMLRLPPTLIWDYPDIGALAAHLADSLAARPGRAPQTETSLTPSLTSVERLLPDLDPLGDRISTASRTQPLRG
jgi:acyl carrier protein